MRSILRIATETLETFNIPHFLYGIPQMMEETYFSSVYFSQFGELLTPYILFIGFANGLCFFYWHGIFISKGGSKTNF